MGSKNPSSDINFQFSSYKKYLLPAFLILFLGFFLRAYNLLSLPIFTDEAIYIRWAQIMKSDETLRFLPLTDGKQPLFMWVVIPFLKFFSDPLIAGRMVSVLSGTASIVGIFLLTQEVFKNKKIGLIAALFYSISPYTVFFSRMALVDSMLTMFGIWALYFGVLTARSLRLDFALLTGFCLGGALLTKSPGLFFILFLPSTYFLANNLKINAYAKILKMACFWLVSSAVAYVMYSILKLGPAYHMLYSRNKDYLFNVKDILSNPLLPFIQNLGQFSSWIIYLIPIFFALLAIYAFYASWREYKREIIIVSFWFTIPFLVEMEIARVFTARYLLFAIFPIFILAAVSTYKLVSVYKKVALVIISLLCLVILYLDYLIISNPEKATLPKHERIGYLEAWTAGTGIREIAQYIKEIHDQDPNAPIVVGSEGSFGALPNGLQMYIEDIPNITVTSHDVPDINEVSMALIVSKRAGDKTYLVINKSRFHGEPSVEGLTILKQYPKAMSEDGTRDYMMLYEVTDKAVEVYDSRRDLKPTKK